MHPGYVYKEAIKNGVGSTMIAHCALPFCEENVDPKLGYPPAILSKSIMTDLLKGERATAKVIMGKIPALGKSSIRLEGFFEREV